MIKFIIKKTINNHQAIEKEKVREAYGVLSGILGILCNLLLFVVKLVIGTTMNSIAITSDAFNNLTDTGSSIITIIGVKLSNQVPDEEHPFGHGRFEYIASLMISFVIILVGFELLQSSISKILDPEPIEFNFVLMIILVISVFLKIWMYSYNKYIGKKINSKINMATATDSINDVFATSTVIITTVIGQYISIPVDGVVGLLVSLLILYTGYEVAKDTVNVLLGMSPSEETVENIRDYLLKSEYIHGAHDLKVHDYGPGRTIASVHVEMSDQINIVRAHREIDKIEKAIHEAMRIDIVIHIDPMPEGSTEPID